MKNKKVNLCKQKFSCFPHGIQKKAAIITKETIPAIIWIGLLVAVGAAVYLIFRKLM